MDTKSPSLSLLHRLAHIILVVLSPQQDLALFSLLKPTVSMSGISLTSLISQVYSSTSHRAPSCTVNSSISSMSTISSTWHMVIKTMVRSSCKRSHQTSKTSFKNEEEIINDFWAREVKKCLFVIEQREQKKEQYSLNKAEEEKRKALAEA